MLCLFPFETAIYSQQGVPVRFVGHPLADEIAASPDRAAARRALDLAPAAKWLALLPGSRAGEVRLLAPLFLRAAQLLRRADPALNFVVPAASAMRMAELRAVLADHPTPGVTLVDGRSREAMAASDAVLLASGTATLEAALLGRPMVVAYRMGTLNWLLLRTLVNTRYASLPNILAGRALVPELLQEQATPAALAAALEPLLNGGAQVTAQLQEFDRIHVELRQGYAERAAQALAALLVRESG